MALEFVLGRVRRDIRLNGSFMAHCCPTTSFRPMAGKAEPQPFIPTNYPSLNRLNARRSRFVGRPF